MATRGTNQRFMRPGLTAAFLLLVLAFVSWRIAVGRIELGTVVALLGASLAFSILVGAALRTKRGNR